MARRHGNADLRPVLPVGAGIARERETSADDAGLCQCECRSTFFVPGGVYGRTRSWAFLPVEAGLTRRRRARLIVSLRTSSPIQSDFNMNLMIIGAIMRFLE